MFRVLANQASGNGKSVHFEYITPQYGRLEYDNWNVSGSLFGPTTSIEIHLIEYVNKYFCCKINFNPIIHKSWYGTKIYIWDIKVR